MSVPVLIAGTLTVQEALNGASLSGYMAVLGAMFFWFSHSSPVGVCHGIAH